ncbi:UNVERIFIED_CONTAM: hypothetical protein FKN15_037456 [Acipenser sinensis]
MGICGVRQQKFRCRKFWGQSQRRRCRWLQRKGSGQETAATAGVSYAILCVLVVVGRDGVNSCPCQKHGLRATVHVVPSVLRCFGTFRNLRASVHSVPQSFAACSDLGAPAPSVPECSSVWKPSVPSLH